MPNIVISITPSLQAIGKAFRSVDLRDFLQKEIENIAFLTESYSKQVVPVDTGRLRSSISTDIGNLRAKVTTGTDYAVYVHEGTRRMRARPFMLWGAEFAERRVEEKDIAQRLDRKLREQLSHI